jgi:PiT family inorganic phosphate transporter
LELHSLAQIDKAAKRGRNDSFRLGVGPIFAVRVMVWTALTQDIAGPQGVMLVAAAVIGGCMAMNIGANDVANAVGPVAAMALGLLLYGPRLIRKVGSEITELDPMRAFRIAMSAAVTAIVASQLGLPVSSTHIAVGRVFGVGFLREWLKRRHAGAVAFIRLRHAGEDRAVVEAFLERFQKASWDTQRAMLKALKARKAAAPISKFERKQLNKEVQRRLVKRSEVMKIVAAWLVTGPVTAALGALPYFTIFGMVHARG